ncbi:unnamed protein product [Oikopleura dioica]|uniref:Uncharacterized protein n=1 Tax=Oikopleura dioica TaxID=34765 RepID=E4YDY9_OIKDI|nr:unnamed protein product [Oikopleura dioica]
MEIGKYDRLVQKYLKKTKRFKTLKEFEKGLDRMKKKDERKPVKLSFAIQKAPERKKIENASLVYKCRQKMKKEIEEIKTVVIPDKFIKIAKKFGLPEGHYDFFYENRDSFCWESNNEKNVHCTIGKCDFSAPANTGSMTSPDNKRRKQR